MAFRAPTLSGFVGPSFRGDKAPAWRTVCDIDFTAQDAQTWTVDGTYVVAGHQLQLLNQANSYGSVTSGITAGAGLKVPFGGTVSTVGYTGSRTAPMVRWGLSNAQQIARGVPMRAAVQLGNLGHYSAIVSAVLAIDYATGAGRYGANIKLSHPVSAQTETVPFAATTWGACRVLNGVATVLQDASNCKTGADQMGIWLPDGVATHAPYRWWLGRSADGALSWDRPGSGMFTHGEMRNYSSAESSNNVSALDHGAMSNWAVALACNTGSGGAWTVWVKRLLVEAYYATW